MRLLGAAPTNTVVAEQLIVKAAEQLARSDWRGAVASLESAAIVATPDALPAIVETLASLYVARNSHEKLSVLVANFGHATPRLAVAGLLLARNRQLGLGRPVSDHPALSGLLPVIRSHVTAGQYSAEELPTICALLVEVKAAEMAVQLLHALLEMGVQVDEELVTGVLTLALQRNKKRDAEAIVDLVGASENFGASLAQRYRILLGKGEGAALAAGQDKVVDFLRRNGNRMGNAGRGRGR